MKFFTAYQTKNPCYNSGDTMTPKGIVVHSTGANNPNVKRYVDFPAELGVNKYGNHWNRNVKKMVHAFIGKNKDGEVVVVQTLPYNRPAWGVGKGKKGSYNYNPTGHIQFEMCEGGSTARAYFDDVIESAVEYCAELCKAYNLSPDTIVGHCEAYKAGYASNHSDPVSWMKKFGMTMDDFRDRVREKLEAKKAPTSYKVRVTTSSLRIRKGPGTNYGKNGTIKDKGVYTITAEAPGKGAKMWGKLKSGVGWISLDYTKKI